IRLGVNSRHTPTKLLAGYTTRLRSFSAAFSEPNFIELLEAPLINLVSLPIKAEHTNDYIPLDAPNLESFTGCATMMYFKAVLWPALKHLDVRHYHGPHLRVARLTAASQDSLESLVLSGGILDYSRWIL
ncbi:hypothetical protein FRB90_007754, partial [Tulasnella sp. 427]